MGISKNKYINRLYYNAPLFAKNLMASCYGYRRRINKYGKHYYDYLNLLKDTEYLSTSDLKEIQFRYLKEFILFAAKYSAYYKSMFERLDFNPDALGDYEELKSLPVITKEEVRKHGDDISCAHRFKNTTISKTSGSSGKPLSMPITAECSQKGYAIEAYLHSWCNLYGHSKNAKCAGQSVAHVDRSKPPFWVYDKLNNGLYLSSYHLSETNIPYYIEELNKFKPDLLEGYPSSLYVLALGGKKYNVAFKPKMIRTGSETLHDFQRELLEEVFQCTVHNYYGSAENCVSAIECKEGNIHLQMLYGYTEFINENGNEAAPGESAVLIASGFSNYAFPLIRYNTEDVVLLSKEQTCRCGRGGVLLEKIVGRIEDYIITPEGNIVRRLGHVFKNTVGVVNAQINQEYKREIVINIVKDHNYNSDSEREIIKEARSRLGNSISIQIKYTNKIEKEPNGKYKFIKSNVSKEMYGINL
jgi:phenylacetate-CoA ligase